MNHLDKHTVKNLFPFYFCINENLKITDAGKSILKIFPDTIGKDLYEIIEFSRPKHKNFRFDDLHRYEDHIIILRFKFNDLKLRGQLSFQVKDNSYYFLGSPWINKSEQLKKYNLTLNDFALHDPTSDMFQILQFNEIAIRDLNQRETELIKSKAELESALAAKSDFLSVMSHEIRTPLNAIIGISDILNEKNRDLNLTEELKTLHFSSESLLTLVNDILDYSKIEAGKIELENNQFSLKDFVLNLEKLFAIKSKERNIKFSIDYPSNLPNFIQGDQTRLGQILINLIGNAIKFTKFGSVHLKLIILERNDSTITIQFHVIDTGIGIPENKLESIFERFSQAHISTGREYGGTGLGLTITKKLIQLYNSDIFVKSEENKGSDFYFKIKFSISNNLDKIAVINNNLQDYQLKILLVDDNPTNLQIASHYLKKRNLKVDFAVNGEEAIQMVNKMQYGIIFMDLEMPVKDGYAATMEIRKLNSFYSSVPIIALSAYPVYEIKEKALYSGFTECLNKPFRSTELNAIINKYISV
jgi:signal transduction histidine kinase/CheY-like chemotaxis protein